SFLRARTIDRVSASTDGNAAASAPSLPASTDLLAFGPHPDDIELGLGGAIARHTSEGHSVVLCDLTEGELGSNGTVEDRRREAEAAAKVLGVRLRENLQWPDGGIEASPD